MIPNTERPLRNEDPDGSSSTCRVPPKQTTFRIHPYFSLQTHMRQKCRYVPEEHRIITRSGNTIIVTITSNCYFADSLNRTTVNVLHVASHDYCGHD